MNGIDRQYRKNLCALFKPIIFFKQRALNRPTLLLCFLFASHVAAAQDPTITGIEGTTLSYDEEQAATAVSGSITVDDADSPMLSSATVTISGNLINSEDVLEFVDAFSITGSFDASTGTLTLNGPASAADFTNALRSVLYKNTNDANPSTLLRTVSFSVTDGLTNSLTVTRNIQVNGINDLPIGQDDSFVMHEDTELDCGCILINDSDPDGDDLIALHGQPPANGTVSDLGGFFIYTPNPNYFGTDTFTYYANDGQGNSNETTVHVTILPVNDAPIAFNDAASTDEDTPVNVVVLSNDIDIDDVLIGSMIVIVDSPSHGTLTVDTNTGEVEYKPSQDYHGSDSFTYQVKDASDALSNVATVTLVINPVNDAPVANPDLATTNEEVAVSIPVLANDIDVDNTLDGSSLILVNAPSHGTAVIEPATGTIQYTPETDYNGNDSFSYQLEDQDGAMSAAAVVTITVAPVNDAPVANPDVATTPEDIPVSISVLSNDTDVDNTWTEAILIISANPSHGAAVVEPATGKILFTPEQNYYGNDSFTYQIKDAQGALSNITSVSIEITPVNDAPVANDDAATTAEEMPFAVDVLANDTDIDNNMNTANLIIVGNPAKGTAVVEANGTISYSPEKDFTGEDSFTYQVEDEAGAKSNVATVTITVINVNDPPVAVDDVATTDENVAIDIDILKNDFDIDNAIVASSVTLTSNPAHGTVVVQASGHVTYTPQVDFIGIDVFTYTIEDEKGLISEPASVSVTVIEVENKAPNAVDDAIENSSLSPIAIDVLANDYDDDNDHADLILTSVTSPGSGTVHISDGKVIYTPAGMINTTVTFSYTIQDPSGLTDEAIVTIENLYPPLMVSEGFSPNSDNNNDTWYIQGIEYYPNNAVKIFDRWGFLVYQKQHYENNSAPWDGRGNAAQHSGKLLDQGTYYYILEPGGELKTMNGYVVIVR
jgi:large repetitive protein